MAALKRIALAILVALGLGGAAAAQPWPSKPIRIVVPFAPGRRADTIGRTIADGLAKSLGQQAFAENRPAGGASASAAVARTQAHLVADALMQEAKVEMEHIPYNGGADAIPDLLSGRVQIGSLAFNTAAPHVKVGSLKALAITTQARMSGFPDVPTFKELGYDKLVASTSFGLAGPPGLPPESPSASTPR